MSWNNNGTVPLYAVFNMRYQYASRMLFVGSVENVPGIKLL